jgi:hypothetical protein
MGYRSSIDPAGNVRANAKKITYARILTIFPLKKSFAFDKTLHFSDHLTPPVFYNGAPVTT